MTENRASARGAELASALLDNDALYDLLQRLTRLARHTVAGSHSASITVQEDGRFRTTNSSGPDAQEIDDAQYRDGDGPCLQAIRSSTQLEAEVSETADRWPGFTEEARRAGVRSVLSTAFTGADDKALGALNVYSNDIGGFGAVEKRTTELIGEQAAVLVGCTLALASSNELNQQLAQAVESRDIIGAAKGILMERQKVSRDQAFDILRRASQRENRKLRDLAGDLVTRVERGTHAVPDGDQHGDQHGDQDGDGDGDRHRDRHRGELR